MEERAVVEAFFGKLHEVLGVQRRVVGKGDTDVADARLDAYDVAFLLFLSFERKRSQAKESDDDK